MKQEKLNDGECLKVYSDLQDEPYVMLQNRNGRIVNVTHDERDNLPNV